MNNEALNWDDLRVFLTLVQTGSLSAAARRLGLSQPTVGRRVQALERALDKRLFERLRSGYTPTAAGEALVPLAESMSTAAEAVARRRAESDELAGAVRISAGASACRFLCSRVATLLEGLPELSLEIAASSQFTNLSRREADIAIRNRLPERGDLVTRVVAHPAVAAYASRDYVARHQVDLGSEGGEKAGWAKWDWVDYDEARQHLATARWLAARAKGARCRVACSTPAEKLDAVKGGAGLGLLSCYAGDGEPALLRVSAPIPELRGSTWLVVHQDLRNVPRIRAVTERLVDLFRENADLFDGKRPLAPIA